MMPTTRSGNKRACSKWRKAHPDKEGWLVTMLLATRWTIETFPFAEQPAVSAPVVKLLAGLDFIGTGTVRWSTGIADASGFGLWSGAPGAKLPQVPVRLVVVDGRRVAAKPWLDLLA